MKIDLRKAYDMVSWEFVIEALEGYGFPSSFIQMVMVCISSTKFSVRINGEGHGYFAGQRGLRQGDPISPLLFVVVMEYLTRTLSKMSKLPDFKFHPMCKEQRLTHLIFADDLMIFCKGDIRSIQRIREALENFGDTTGLVANVEKSNIFLAGITDYLKEEILEMTGYSLGTLPIRYLGLPLSSKKWGKMECHQLVEKITERVTNVYARKLSYAGRLQAVDRKCKDFIWGSSTDQRKAHLVAWDKVCLPKKFGGLNVNRYRNWNEVSVGKLLLQVSEKQDILWMVDWYQNDKYKVTKCGTYSVTRRYNVLIGAQTRLWEANLIWTKIMQPKHRFIVWLANQNRLLTKSRMMRLNIHVEDTKCCLCLAGVVETPQHLFSECEWITAVRHGLANWLEVQMIQKDVPQSLKWIKRRKWKQIQKGSCGGNMGGNDLSHMESKELEDFLKHRCEYKLCDCTDTGRSESSTSHSPEHKGCCEVSDSVEKTN
ncbi:uncharacterized protein LOC125825449 [Solanum verrucosum]|uniref:uncharacterized protein LOC125825449 n=1 Tax=Solanum verrucosum TaxID=315347 RepID=UPI0020CFF6E4|nr:uncharacterized protein LOC125825449 [Solanum verrucosum]